MPTVIYVACCQLVNEHMGQISWVKNVTNSSNVYGLVWLLMTNVTDLLTAESSGEIVWKLVSIWWSYWQEYSETFLTQWPTARPFASSCGNKMMWWLPSVLWHCWLGVRKSIWPVKNWVMRYWHGYLSALRCKWSTDGPADATATPSCLASLNCRLV